MCALLSGYDACFIGNIDQDWDTDNNWDDQIVPDDFHDIVIGYVHPSYSNQGPYDVNIGDGTAPGDLVIIGDGSNGSLDILDQNSLTIKEHSTLDHTPESGVQTIYVRDGATLTIDGTLNNGNALPFGNLALIIIESGGLVVISSTGVLNHFGDITGDGEIQVCVGGTFNDQGFVDPNINQTVCAGAPVGSISIPLESTQMLVAANQMNSIWITLGIATAIGISAILVTKKLKN